MLFLHHGLSLVRKLQQVPVRVGHHDILSLAPYPATHIDVAVGGTGPGGVDIEADTGIACLAHPASSTGDVERHGDQVTHLDELNIATEFNDFTGEHVH